MTATGSSSRPGRRPPGHAAADRARATPGDAPAGSELVGLIEATADTDPEAAGAREAYAARLADVGRAPP